MPLWTAGAGRRELFHGPPYPVDTSDPHDHQVWCELVWKWENGDVYLDSRGWSNCQVNTCVLDFGTSVIHSVQKTGISNGLGLFICGTTKWNEIKPPSNCKIIKKLSFSSITITAAKSGDKSFPPTNICWSCHIYHMFAFHPRCCLEQQAPQLL